ncbi:PAS domain-containing protein [Sulfidibacter corallicola]|uniref:histidine kinase n=1 Tax=Sulfidibacter corallicola TaxID=2818388 RepID=A0A8A4TK04_SULCO|nr:ATP-binding protein [Sulfidibacter corallicola]QTD50349.1 PAS domain-containing protein [Sulfidibacter corallicola]
MQENTNSPEGCHPTPYRGFFNGSHLFQDIGKSCEDITGFSSDALIGKPTYKDLIHPEDFSEIGTKVHQSLDHGLPYRLVYRIRTRSGKEKWVSELGIGAKPENGEPPQIRGFISDITHLKRAHDANQAHKEVLELITGGVNLNCVLRKLVDTAEALVPDMYCSVLILDPETKTLLEGAAPSLPQWYRAAVDGLPIGEKVGSCGAAAATGKRVVVPDILDHPNWAFFHELAKRLELRACWSQPIITDNQVLGTFAMYYRYVSQPSPGEIDLINSYAHIAGIAIQHARSLGTLQRTNRDLDIKIKLKNKELQEVREELIEAAHFAGMAEIATDVLHNVGNILNTFRITSQSVLEKLNHSSFGTLHRVATSFREDRPKAELLEKMGEDKLIDLILKLERALSQEKQELIEDALKMQASGDKILEIVRAQQKYTDYTQIEEFAHLTTLVEDAVTFVAGGLAKSGISIERSYSPVSPIKIHKSKLINILACLLTNAKEALEAVTEGDRKIWIKVFMEGTGTVCLTIRDSGRGIRPEHRDKIFHQGFSTKSERPGISLHMAANYMKEMGGRIEVESDGVGKGACFCLKFVV